MSPKIAKKCTKTSSFEIERRNNMNKTKSLSLLLVLCMILGLIPFSFAVSADETAAVYYVMYGADGDGLTRETPMGDIAEAIAAIEGNAAVDEGTVYVLNDPNVENYFPAGEKYHKYLTWTTPAAHTKPIHVIGLDENSKTVIMSTAESEPPGCPALAAWIISTISLRS